MSAGIVATVTWQIKPELVETFVETLRDMFPVTRQHRGFQNIRLLRSENDQNCFFLIQEWDDVQDHRDYTQFRIDSGGVAELSAMAANAPQLHYWDMSPLAAAQA